MLFPGAFHRKDAYRYDGVDVWLRKTPPGEFAPDSFPPADCYIGHSAGGAYLLAHYDPASRAKVILVNPLVRHWNIFQLAWFIFAHHLPDIDWKWIVPAASWPHGIALDAGHFWNRNLAEAVREAIRKFEGSGN